MFENRIVKAWKRHILKFFLFAGFGALLFWLVYRNQDFGELIDKLGSVNYWWFIPAFFMLFLSHISRAARWNMLIEVAGNKPRLINTFLAVLVGYLANLAIPRLGEVTRCGVVARYDKTAFSNVLGTVVTERIVDLLVLLLLTLIVIFSQGTVVREFLADNPEINDKISFIFSYKFWILVVVAGIGGLVLLYMVAKGKFNRWKLFRKIHKFTMEFMEGIKSIRKVKNIPVFILHSIFIWAMYFFMLYACFPAFEGFEDLTIITALTLFVASSFGMLAPSPNGIGAYHFMTINTLILYGISAADASLFALLVHGLQTFSLLILGLIALVLLPVVNRNQI